MSYKDLVESDVPTPKMKSYPTDSELIAVALRIPRMMSDLTKEHVMLNGLNFTSLVKRRPIEKLTVSRGWN